MDFRLGVAAAFVEASATMTQNSFRTCQRATYAADDVDESDCAFRLCHSINRRRQSDKDHCL